MTVLKHGLTKILQKVASDVVILSAVRSPITKAFKGGFSKAYPEDILWPVMVQAVNCAKILTGDLADVLIGNVLAELGFAKTGRLALNHAGFPNSTTFHTVNRQCSSSLQAITHVSNSIIAGQFSVGMAGGVESMSRNYGSRGLPRDVSPALTNSKYKDARDCLMPMGLTSENVSERFGIGRFVQDEFALESQRKASEAQRTRRFEDELTVVSYSYTDSSTGEKFNVKVDSDDGVRHNLTMEKLKKPKPAFKDYGCSTPGNSSQISDGSAAIILARRSWAEERGLKPIGRFVASQLCGCAPDEMGISPISAISLLLARLNLFVHDLDLIELNEAFASQAIHCINTLGLDYCKVNPNGGAIALGHPTGATGARMTATLLAELKKQDGELGIVSMCASTGIGIATLFIRE